MSKCYSLLVSFSVGFYYNEFNFHVLINDTTLFLLSRKFQHNVSSKFGIPRTMLKGWEQEYSQVYITFTIHIYFM